MTIACRSFALLVCLGSLGGLRAAELRLEVRDQSGAAATASVRVEGAGAGTVAAAVETDANGIYRALELQPGSYRVTVSRPGFATQILTVKIGNAAVTRTVTLALAAQASSIEVAAPTPLLGTDLPLNEIPAPVQTGSARALERSGAADLPDFLNRRLGSVHVNENQGNPFQPDLNYRGYTASPLLGTPQGISVYLDGVRQNQPMGDLVAWDLIPKIAISELVLMPGSNPLFGLNSLGGALALETKDGLSAPGTVVELRGGSFGRRNGALEHGGSTHAGFHYYAAVNWLKEDGWRQHSPLPVSTLSA